MQRECTHNGALAVTAARRCVPLRPHRTVHLTNAGRIALADITVPVLIMAGETEPDPPPAMMMMRMVARLPKAGYAALPAVGYLMNLEPPVAFQAALTSFLSGPE